MTKHPTVMAFAGDVCIAAGEIPHVARAARKAAARQHHEPILVFDTTTAERVELDLRGTDDEVSLRFSAATLAGPPSVEAPRGPGRPKLGVVAREVTLLPRHWEWLASQPGGASVALRKLVEHATRANAGKDRVRAAQNAAYRFISVMAGDRVGFENTARALFAGDAAAFNRLVDAWPKDIRDHAKKLAADALQDEKSAVIIS
jgi:uncharacterized protein